MLKFLRTTALATLGVAVASLAAANPYKPYEGETLVVNFPAHPHYDAVLKVLPEFT
ncbi:MAG: sugar ABC transporter substrate-binding protein, partial [Pseudomonadota bacterium]